MEYGGQATKLKSQFMEYGGQATKQNLEDLLFFYFVTLPSE